MEKRQRKKGSGSAYVAVIIALMLLVVIMGVSVFFKVSSIEVSGTSAYTDGEVIEASGIRLEDSIFFLNESSAAVSIKKALSYVDEVRIVKTLPGSVTIEIKESVAVAAFRYSDSLWIVDDNAKVLEIAELSRAGEYMEILGIEPIMPALGDVLSLGEEGQVRLDFLKETLRELHRAGIYKDVNWLDMENLGAISFLYKGTITVNLGRGTGVQDKLWIMSKTLEGHSETRKARIDVSEENIGRYIPE